MGVQHIDHTVRGALSHPTPQGRWAQQLGKIPESCVRRMHKATLRTLRRHRQTFGEKNNNRSSTPKEGTNVRSFWRRRQGSASNGWPAVGRQAPRFAHSRHWRPCGPAVRPKIPAIFVALLYNPRDTCPRRLHAFCCSTTLRSFSPAPARRPCRACAEARPTRLRRVRRLAPLQSAAPRGSGLICASPSGRLPAHAFQRRRGPLHHVSLWPHSASHFHHAKTRGVE